ncbi:MAG: GatB/YqeY domain-containing protein [Anaerolineaceae bacterium]|nr:GatB/YqeY domain-containing protein [Anaerolineaceae bacterium]
MKTKQTLEVALKDAMRTSNEMRKRVIRLVLAAIKLAEVEKRAPLEEDEVVAILQKDIKLHRETIQGAEKAARPDLIENNLDEITILESFLPPQLSENELRKLAISVIQEVGASSPKDMSKVMNALLKNVQGRASSDVVSKIVRELLNN